VELVEAESHLPSDNLPPVGQAFQPVQNRALEPEPRPPLIVLQPSQPKTKAKPEKEPDHPMIFSHEEFGVLKPMFDWLKEHDDLRIEVAEVIRNYRDKNNIDLTA
jgi:hypothetical protein